MKHLEDKRQAKEIGSGLEAQVSVAASDTTYELLRRYEALLRELFIVSKVVLEKAPSGNGSAGLKVAVTRAPGQKCERCWNYSVHVGEDKEHPSVCERCSAALKEMQRG